MIRSAGLIVTAGDEWKENWNPLDQHVLERVVIVFTATQFCDKQERYSHFHFLNSFWSLRDLTASVFTTRADSLQH